MAYYYRNEINYLHCSITKIPIGYNQRLLKRFLDLNITSGSKTAPHSIKK